MVMLINVFCDDYAVSTQWAAGGFEEFLNIMNFYVFLIVWDNRVNKL